MDKKGLDYDGFRSLAVWLMDKITGLWNEKINLFHETEQAQQAILDTAKSQYAGAVYLTQAEYDALSEEEKMDASKVYFIEEE
jgi:hypothetical protein